MESIQSNVKTVTGFHLVTDPHGCFSNWYKSEFRYGRFVYNCTEQYMMAQKVLLGRRYDLFEKIMKSDDPAEIKAYAGKGSFNEFADIKDVWDKICYKVVKRGVRAKFSQNPEMLRELLDTGNSLLCECSASDIIWGIGINYNDPSWRDVKKWRGKNYLGRILMEIRDELREVENKKGKVEFTDYTDAPPIDEWKVDFCHLKRIPKYYNAVYTYAAQLSANDRKAFYCVPGDCLEDAMRTNMGGGLPIQGFYEMKQEIYEIAGR